MSTGVVSDPRTSHPVSERFVYLCEDKVVVPGAKYALVVDFATGGLHRLNAPALRILELSRQGIGVEKALEQLELDFDDADSLLAGMLSQNLITVETKPRLTAAEDSPAPTPSLKFAWLEVLSQCNLRCLHCYAEAPSKQMPMPATRTLLDWIGQISDLGCRKIQLTGGECTLRKDLKDLLSFARDKNYEMIEIFTNATFSDESLIPFLAENRIQVAISLYSHKADTHDQITGVPGSHKRTMENLKMMLACGVDVRGSIIALKQNENDVAAAEMLLREIGVCVGPADPVRPCGRGKNMEYWPEKYGRSFLRTKPDFVFERTHFDANHHWNSCWFGKAAISADGDVFPCVFSREFRAGNLYETPLEGIVSGPLKDHWGITRDKISVCSDCEYRYLCRDCRSWAYGFTGDLYAKSPTCTYDPYSGEWGPAEGALDAPKS